MNKFKLVAAILVVVLVLSSVSTVFAQSVDTTPPPPTEEPGTLPGTDVTTPEANINPIVKLLAQFFSFLFIVPVPTETVTPTVDPLLVDVTVTPEPTLLTPEEQVAAYHDAGLGFGVLVKLFSIASSAADECKLTGTLCDVTIDSLIAQFQGGQGIGQLEKLYGKPEFLGIGQVRHNQGNGQGNGQGKDKPKK